MLLQTFGSYHVKMARMRQKAMILLEISRVNFIRTSGIFSGIQEVAKLGRGASATLGERNSGLGGRGPTQKYINRHPWLSSLYKQIIAAPNLRTFLLCPEIFQLCINFEQVRGILTGLLPLLAVHVQCWP